MKTKIKNLKEKATKKLEVLKEKTLYSADMFAVFAMVTSVLFMACLVGKSAIIACLSFFGVFIACHLVISFIALYVALSNKYVVCVACLLIMAKPLLIN